MCCQLQRRSLWEKMIELELYLFLLTVVGMLNLVGNLVKLILF